MPPRQMLVEEATHPPSTWQDIVENFQKSSKPVCLFEETDLIKRAVISAVDKKYDRLLVDDYGTYHQCKRLYEKYSNEHPLKIELYRDKSPMFERFNVEREIHRAPKRKLLAA
jgi:ribonuclease G